MTKWSAVSFQGTIAPKIKCKICDLQQKDDVHYSIIVRFHQLFIPSLKGGQCNV